MSQTLDMPDYTFPVDIVAQSIGNLAVDIVAQTLGNLTVDIAAQSLAALDVKLTGSEVTIDVNIASQTAALNVNIESISAGVVFNVAQSGTWTINAVQSGAWTINIGAPLDESGNLATSIQSSVQLDVNIAASAVTLNVNIESISSGVVFNVAQSGDWTINAVQSGAWTINIGAPLDEGGNLKTAIVESVQLDVNIAASAATVNVAIQSSDVTLNVAIQSSDVTLDVNVANRVISVGQVGFALSFDGTDDYVEVADSPSLNPPSEITVIAWVKLNTLDQSDSYPLVVQKYSPPDNGYFMGYMTSTHQMRFALLDGAYHQVRSAEITDLNWHMYAGVWDGAKLYFYTDAKLEDSADYSGPYVQNTGPLRIGAYSYYLQRLNGIIASVCIYNRALSAEEIQHNYENPCSPITNGLVLWLPFDEGAGNVAHDRSGLGNDGTIHGATWVSREGSVPASVGVNIQSSLVTLDVNITNTSVAVTNVSGQSLDVSVTSSVTLDVNVTNTSLAVTNVEGENLNVAVQSSVTLDVNVTNTSIAVTNVAGENLNVAVQSSVTLDVNITNTSVPITNVEGQNLNVAIQSSTTLDVNVTNTSIAVTNVEGESLSVSVASSTTLNVNIANAPIEITNVEGENLNVAIQSSITLNTNITEVAGTVTMNVNIKEIAGDVTFNIATESGANIVIDKLTQDAYTPRRTDYYNHGTTASWSSITNTTYCGKWFPRGCRGFLDNVQVYMRNPDSASHTVTIYLAPQMGMAPIYSESKTISAGMSAQWVFFHPRMMWNYDSMFIYIIADDPDYPQIAYDSGTPVDAYHSSELETWFFQERRYWIKLGYTGLTVGDLPVSGTVNTVEIPASASRFTGTSVSVPPLTETTVAVIEGSGTLVEATLQFETTTPPTSTEFYEILVYVDGKFAGTWMNSDFTLSTTATSGANRSGKFCQLADVTLMSLWLPLKFRRRIEFRAHHTLDSAVNVTAFITVNLIS